MERANVLLRRVRWNYFVLPIPLPLPSQGESGGLASEEGVFTFSFAFPFSFASAFSFALGRGTYRMWEVAIMIKKRGRRRAWRGAAS